MSLENSCANPAFPLPIGCIMPYMGLANSIPPTFLVCDGRTVSKADFPELFLVLTNTFNGTASVPAGQFKLPKLDSTETYLVPNGTLKTDPTRANGIIAPSLHSSDVLPALTGVQIPQLDQANFSAVNPKDQEGIVGRSFNARGDYQTSRYLATDSTGSSNPPIVKLDSSNESGGFASMTAADYIYQNPTPAAIGDIILNDNHSVQYGGMSCIYIIKAFSSYALSASKNAAINRVEEQEAAFAVEVAAQKAAEVVATNLQDAANDTRAADAASATAADGEGGGTIIEYSNFPELIPNPVPPFSPPFIKNPNFCPALGGFIISPNPSF